MIGIDLAQALIERGVPVIVCKSNARWKPGGKSRELIPPEGWNTITAAECDLSTFRPGKDTLALVGGHGIDLVDIDAKTGAHLDDLPPFRRYGMTRTPGGGWHLWVPSTGYDRLVPLIVGGKPVGDYVGGNAEGGGRQLGYLPGSTRPKYPGGEYTVEEPIDLDALFDSEPDDDLIAMLTGAGARRTGKAGSKAATSDEVRDFLDRHAHAYAQRCNYGRTAMRGILDEAQRAEQAQGGRHGWAVRSATRLVELMRTGCAGRTDYDDLVATLTRIKPEGGTDLDDVMRWAIANAQGSGDCGLHTARDALDGSDGFGEGKPPAQILDAVLKFIRQYVAFPNDESAIAVVAWIAHTHLLDHFDSTPRLAIVAPEKGSGKTRTLEVIEPVVPNSLRSSSTTTAVLFRLIDSDQRPTVLIDEADALWSERGANEELRALLNAGHRRGSDVHRMVGEGAAMKAQRFATFAAVALAGIGDLPDTLMDRSVAIRMKRRAPHEKVEPWRFRDGNAVGGLLREALAVWARSVDRVPMPQLDDITDRTADIWEPLIAVADLAGDHWPDSVRHACKVLTDNVDSADMSLRLRLLSDLREVWPEGYTFTATAELLQRLAEVPEAPWGLDGPFGLSGLTARKLSNLLHHYAVKPQQDAAKTVRGYRRSDLEDAWIRYLPPLPEPSKPSEPSGQATLEVAS
jgi:hypothetical protein